MYKSKAEKDPDCDSSTKNWSPTKAASTKGASNQQNNRKKTEGRVWRPKVQTEQETPPPAPMAKKSQRRKPKQKKKIYVPKSKTTE